MNKKKNLTYCATKFCEFKIIFQFKYFLLFWKCFLITCPNKAYTGSGKKTTIDNKFNFLIIIIVNEIVLWKINKYNKKTGKSYYCAIIFCEFFISFFFNLNNFYSAVFFFSYFFLICLVKIIWIQMHYIGKLSCWKQ